jgi:hypothetical protein
MINNVASNIEVRGMAVSVYKPRQWPIKLK